MTFSKRFIPPSQALTIMLLAMLQSWSANEGGDDGWW